MKKLFLAPVLGLALVACGNSTKSEQTDSTATVDSAQAVETVATATVEGTFEGVLPGADNDGALTTIVLNLDGTYTETSTAKGQTFSEQGKYMLNGDTLALTAEASEKFALLQGDSISLLDGDKKAPAMPYVLRKK